MNMKFYVAGKFEKKEMILKIYEIIKEKGHQISYDWTVHKNIKPYLENKEIAKVYADNELKGIADCDIMIYLADEKGTTLPMEFGAALMSLKTKGKPKVYAVGTDNSKSPWFFNSLVQRKNSVDEVLKELNL